MARLQDVATDEPAIGDVRGLGLMVGTELVDGAGRPDGALAARVLAEAASRGLLLLACGAQGQVVRFIPPLVVEATHVDEAVAIYAESLGKALAA